MFFWSIIWVGNTTVIKDAHPTSTAPKKDSSQFSAYKAPNYSCYSMSYFPPPSLSSFCYFFENNILTYSHSLLLPSPFHLTVELTSSRDANVKWILFPNVLFVFYFIESLISLKYE